MKEHGLHGLKLYEPFKLGVVIHTFNSSTGRQRQRNVYEFKDSLVYKLSSRTARAIYKNPDFKTKQNKQSKQEHVGTNLTGQNI